MKDVKKVFGILSMGVVVAIFCYPFLHELGHAIAVLITGATLYEFQIFPIPYVLCDNGEIGRLGNAVIGMAGMVFPFSFSMLLNSKRFWLWLFSFYLKGISALAFALSYVAVLCYESKIVWQNEDIIKIIELSGMSSSFWLVVMLTLFCLCASSIYFNKPIKRIENFFGI